MTGPDAAELETVTVPESRRGPTHSGNGGIVAGLMAARLGDAATVTLRRPIPLDRPLTLAVAGPRARLTDGEALLAEAAAEAGPVEGPGPVTPEIAAAASARPLVEDARHGAPRCWVCGPLAAAEAMHVRTGPTGLAPGEGPPCAALWTPGPAQAEPDGRLGVEHLWGALDCPSGVAAMAAEAGRDIHEIALLLGRVTGRIERRPLAGAPLVVTARGVGREGRKWFAESALHDAEGRRVAAARSVWIEVDPAKLAATL